MLLEFFYKKLAGLSEDITKILHVSAKAETFVKNYNLILTSDLCKRYVKLAEQLDNNYRPESVEQTLDSILIGYDAETIATGTTSNNHYIKNVAQQYPDRNIYIQQVANVLDRLVVYIARNGMTHYYLFDNRSQAMTDNTNAISNLDSINNAGIQLNRIVRYRIWCKLVKAIGLLFNCNRIWNVDNLYNQHTFRNINERIITINYGGQTCNIDPVLQYLPLSSLICINFLQEDPIPCQLYHLKYQRLQEDSIAWLISYSALLSQLRNVRISKEKI
jgi:hypothetical protein